MSYMPIDDPYQLYHNVVVVLDKAADINHGQPSALARGIDANGSKVGRAASLLTSHIYNSPTFEP